MATVMTMANSIALACTPVNDEENREHARQYGMETLLPSTEPPPGYIRRSCYHHGGEVWISPVNLGRVVRLKTAGERAVLVCKVCVAARNKGML